MSSNQQLRPVTRRAKAPRFGWLLALAASGAAAQSTDTNVVTASTDAFGVAIGVEVLGVYSPSQVRGFDPLSAGNARAFSRPTHSECPVLTFGLGRGWVDVRRSVG